jgi:hypothetical protein
VGKAVNGRGVWKQEGREQFMWYAESNWGVGDEERMKENKRGLMLYVVSTALTPDQITEKWREWDNTGEKFVGAPTVGARLE